MILLNSAMKISIVALQFARAIQAAAIEPHQKRGISRQEPPQGCLVVRGSGTQAGEYATLQSAVNAVSKSGPSCIFIHQGTYTGQTDIKDKHGLTLYGATSNTGNYKNNRVKFTNKLGSYDAGSLDASSTVNVRSQNFSAYNIDFVNEYTDGQAVALTSNGNKTGFYGCSFKSFQDTLYVKNGWQYYSNCYIEGAVDYIFGNGHVWIGESDIVSSRGGYITASSRTYDNDTSRYIIDHSVVKSTGTNTAVGSVFLGRPWRVNARIMFQNSHLSDVVHPKGWTTMAAGATPIFQEFGNSGPGANTSAREYLAFADRSLTKNDVFGKDFKWYDDSY